LEQAEREKRLLLQLVNSIKQQSAKARVPPLNMNKVNPPANDGLLSEPADEVELIADLQMLDSVSVTASNDLNKAFELTDNTVDDKQRQDIGRIFDDLSQRRKQRAVPDPE
jgi:hypothetical protein